MLLSGLRKEVLEANLELVRQGLVLFTFGNASALSREDRLVVIKPSGVPYEKLRPEDMVVTDLQGKVVDGNLRPSSDLDTHLVLYRRFPHIGGVAHTHSEFATAWAQACRPIPCLGTTHADYFHGEVPVTAALTAEEIAAEYEANSGHAICRIFSDALATSVPGVLVSGHGPFTWGATGAEAVHNAVILEAIARMAYRTLQLAEPAAPIGRALHTSITCASTEVKRTTDRQRRSEFCIQPAVPRGP
jgi:L-ribulose-5-phosphate 4-epimerase